MELINKVLAFFGLMKINRAKRLTEHLHIFYLQSVLDGIEQDFGRKAKPEAIEVGKQWWKKEFDRIMNHCTDNVAITTKPEFKEFIKTDV